MIAADSASRDKRIEAKKKKEEDKQVASKQTMLDAGRQSRDRRKTKK
jgi:hypothetical protein